MNWTRVELSARAFARDRSDIEGMGEHAESKNRFATGKETVGVKVAHRVLNVSGVFKSAKESEKAFRDATGATIAKKQGTGKEDPTIEQSIVSAKHLLACLDAICALKIRD